MVGKLTWYRATSSITCALFDRAKFFDKHGCLKKAIAEKNGTLVDNFVQTNRQATGDLLEPVLITEAAKRLGIEKVEAEVDYKIDHPELPLQASLDGRCNVINLKVEYNPDNGIYILGHKELILNGADIVKIGIGPGSVCTTRTMTGVGVPQFSAIWECSDAANGVDGHIMADGGCVYPGDIAKAFGGGAHMVMIGGMLAGHDESEQPVVDGKVEFYGMSSDRAREKHGKRKDGYRGNEGRLISLPHRGPVEATLEDILGGVRSACTYIGARRLKDMAKCASFVTTNNVINRVYEQYTK